MSARQRSNSAHSGDSKASGEKLPEEHVLWTSFLQGNELAFSILYKKYVQVLYNYGMNIVHHHDLVMDCLQELFSVLWDTRDRLSTVRQVKPYLFKSFRRLVLKQISSDRRFSQLAGEEFECFELSMSIENTVMEDEIRQAQSLQLKKCIQSLSKRQREAIFLKFYNGLTYSEISEVMDIRKESLYNLISKSIDLLGKKLKLQEIVVVAFLVFFWS